MNDFFFEGGAENAIGSEEQLLKALSAGYGTEAAQFTGGRALVPEDIETTMVNAMTAQPEDCKMMNTAKKTPVKSTVHEYNRRTGTGDYEFRSVEEAGDPAEGGQDIERVIREVKYLSEYREVTEQMRVVETLEDAFESEKLAGTLNLLKAAEYQCFHGDASVVGTQFNGLIKQIKDTPVARRNIKDYRGQTIGTVGKNGIVDIMRNIYDQGGSANKAFFPPVLAMDIQALAENSYRILEKDRAISPLLDSLPTPYGTLSFGEETAGSDKFFRVKGVVAAKGNEQKRPNAPTEVTASATADDNSKFLAANAGNYGYTVHAINRFGISGGTSVSGAVAVGTGNKVTLTITPDSNKPGEGFIICRTGKGGSVAMEMARIGRDTQNADTTFVDLNDDLPGTSEMLIITEQKIQRIVEFYQLLPLRLYRLPPTLRLTNPFVIALWGMINLKVPEFCGLIKNIQYEGGIVY